LQTGQLSGWWISLEPWCVAERWRGSRYYGSIFRYPPVGVLG
jgi:hypothetical protein